MKTSSSNPENSTPAKAFGPNTWIEHTRSGPQEAPEGRLLWYFFHICGINLGTYESNDCFCGPRGFLTGDVTHYMLTPEFTPGALRPFPGQLTPKLYKELPHNTWVPFEFEDFEILQQERVFCLLEDDTAFHVGALKSFELDAQLKTVHQIRFVAPVRTGNPLPATEKTPVRIKAWIKAPLLTRKVQQEVQEREIRSRAHFAKPHEVPQLDWTGYDFED